MSLNKVQLIGNVGRDPEVRYLDSGVAVATFPLATTDRGYTLANGTQVPERTEWHNIVLWRGLAEVAEKYVRKGDKLYIEGKIRSRSYDDANGNKRYVTEIHADRIEFYSTGSRPATDNGNQAQSPETQYSTNPTTMQTNVAPSNNMSQMDDADDLPF